MLKLSLPEAALIASLIGVTISFLSVITLFINVNRQKKATQYIDEEKFKRKLRLKTYDEIVEILFLLLNIVQKFRILDHRYQQVMQRKNNDIISELNELTWEITDNWFNTITQINSYYMKREIVLRPLKNDFETLQAQTEKLDQLLWQFKGHIWDLNREDMEQLVGYMKKESERSIELLNTTILKLQVEFLGHIFKE